MIAIRHLRSADPVLARIIDRVGPCTLQPREEGTHFDEILRAIVYQQLSGKAAATIHGRILALFGGRPPTPAELLATADEPLRAAGLSRQKLGYLRDLATRASDGEVPFDRLHELGDAEIIESLTRVKGVGRWTVQMFLMFKLGRPDVLPDLDLGIQNAIQRAYGLRNRPTPKQVLELGACWSPHATIASWYLWRSLELPDESGSARTGKRAKSVGTAKDAKKASVKRTRAKKTVGSKKSARGMKKAGAKKSGAKRARRAT
jgi:DNA-3-methyladenine glycosylase II